MVTINPVSLPQVMFILFWYLKSLNGFKKEITLRAVLYLLLFMFVQILSTKILLQPHAKAATNKCGGSQRNSKIPLQTLTNKTWRN